MDYACSTSNARTMTSLLKLLIPAVALLGCVPGYATSITFRIDPVYTSTVDVDRTVDGGGTWIQESPGQFHLITQLGAPASIPLDFYTFCIEPLDVVIPGDFYTFDLNPLEQGTTNIGGMGSVKADLLRELLYTFYPDFSVQLSGDTAAALQAVIWEIVREDSGSLSLTAGDVQYANWSNPAVETLANSMLVSLTGSAPRVTNVMALTLDTAQDLMVQVTPEPATFLLAGPVLLLFALRRKR
jgi:hypothetical protein